MKSELLVDVQPEEISIALTEDDRLMEVSREVRQEQTFAVGNIYYGRVKKVMPSLNAVFVDVGAEKEAFLHYLDLGSQFLTLEKFTQYATQNPRRRPHLEQTPVQPEVGKHGNIEQYCRVGQEILVQVIKEPINTKGPRLTAEISLAGRNIVLIPFGEKVMVSSKIRSEGERSRLKQLVQVIKPAHFGVIVRTQAEGKRAAELDAELKLLLRRWEETVARLQKAKPVSLVMEEIGRTIGVIRDIFTPENFTAIYVNDEEMYREVREYVGMIAPESEKIVHQYKQAEPIFDHFGVTRQMKTGLGRTVGFKNGGYLIMERTEALFSIDVNSGSKKLGVDQEDNAYKCNMLAAEEIVHQLRLRDIGGIIIVDFIDMDSAEHRQMLFEQMRKLMKRDRARHNVLQLSKFGLMQITRQRVRPAVEMDVREECPTCHGTGKIEPSLLFTDKLAQECQRYSDQFGRGLTLRLHPFICAFVEKGLLWNSLKWQWQRKYGVKVISSEMLGMLEYRFFDKNLQRLLIPEKAKLTTDQKAEAKAKIYATKPVQEKPEVVLKEEATEETKVQEQPKTEQPAEAPKKKSSRKKTKAETTPEQSKQEQPQQEQPKADQPAEASKKKRSRKKAKTETTPEQSKQEEPQQEQSKAEQPKEDQTETPKQGKPKSARKSRAAKAAKKETAPTDSANQA
jgi:ribonuclease G